MSTDHHTATATTSRPAHPVDATATDPYDDPNRTTGTEPATQVWTIEAVRALGTTTDVATAAAILGFGRTKAYELAKSNQFPVQTLRIGRRYIVPVSAILRLLDAD